MGDRVMREADPTLTIFGFSGYKELVFLILFCGIGMALED